jgi:hypothetical protein
MADSTRIREDFGWAPTHSELDLIINDGWQSLRSQVDPGAVVGRVQAGDERGDFVEIA